MSNDTFSRRQLSRGPIPLSEVKETGLGRIRLNDKFTRRALRRDGGLSQNENNQVALETCEPQ
jgi:hypothetical protein